MKKAFVLKWLPGKRTRENRTVRPSLGKGRNPVSETPHWETGTLSSTIFAPGKALGTTAQPRQSVSGPSILERSAWDSQQLAETGRGLESGPHGLAAAHGPQPTSWSAHAPPVRGPRRTLSSRAPWGAQLTHARGGTLPGRMEGS